MSDSPTSAPPVRPLGELDWTPKDARWLAGGKRLQLVLAILLIALMLTPARVVESGELAGRSDFGSTTHPAAPQASGIYWRWSVFLEDRYSRSGPDPDRQPARSVFFDRWAVTLLPAAMALAVAAGLLLRPRGRALLLIFVGLVPLVGPTPSWGFPLAAVSYGDPAPFFINRAGAGLSMPAGSPAGAAFFDNATLLVLFVVAVGAHRGVMRGAGGAARRVVPLAATLPLFVPLAVVTLVQIAAGDYRSLLGPQMEFSEATEYLGWPRLALFGVCRTGLFVFCLQSLVNAFAADRRIAAGALVVGGLGLACAVGVATLGAAEIGCFFWREDPRYDWMLNSGIAAHRLIPPAVGMVLMVGGVGRLLVAASRPRQGGAR